MKNSIFLSAILAVTFVSCENKRIQDLSKKEAPAALEEKSAAEEIMSMRGRGDLVDRLYEELVERDVVLKRLEVQIEELNDSKRDSIESFDKFDGKVKAYFSASERYVSEIKDSLLRNKVKLLLANNLKNYNSQMAKQNELIKVIAEREMTISDLHNALKIVKTLPLIEKYQKDNLPGIKPLEGFIKQQDQAISLADTLLKR